MTRPVKPKKALLDPAQIVPIVADACIAGALAEGVNVPLVIVDTSSRPELAEAIRVQQHLPPGDVTVQWASLADHSDAIVLVLDLLRPVETRVVLQFSIERQGILVEAALTSGLIYLQAGKPGDRLKHDLDRPKMTIEIPDTGFRSEWDELFLRRLTAFFRRHRRRLSRREARRMATEAIERMRVVTDFRMPQR